MEGRKEGREGGRGYDISISERIEMAKRSSSFRACLIVTHGCWHRPWSVVVVLVASPRRKRLRISNVGTVPINIFGII